MSHSCWRNYLLVPIGLNLSPLCVSYLESLEPNLGDTSPTHRTLGRDNLLLISPFLTSFVKLHSCAFSSWFFSSSWVFLACLAGSGHFLLWEINETWWGFVTFKLAIWSKLKIKSSTFPACVHWNIHLCSLKATNRSSQYCTPLLIEFSFLREEWSSIVQSWGP